MEETRGRQRRRAAVIDLDRKAIRRRPLKNLLELVDRMARDEEEEARGKPPAVMRLPTVFHQVLAQALDYNANCLHVFEDRAAQFWRLQLYMPVRDGYRQRQWSKPWSDDDLPQDWTHKDLRARSWRGWWGRVEYLEPYYHTEYRSHPRPASSTRRAWVEMHPLDEYRGQKFLAWLRRAVEADGKSLARLRLRYGARIRIAHLDFNANPGAVVYFTKRRPTLRPFPNPPTPRAKTRRSGSR